MVLFVREEELRKKPLFGDPCNRCGLCCLREPCHTAQQVIGQTHGACAALRSDGLGGFVCGLAALLQERLDLPAMLRRDPAPLREAVAIATGAGLGCDMTETRADVAVHEDRGPRMRVAAREARRRASPLAEALLRGWRLSPP